MFSRRQLIAQYLGREDAVSMRDVRAFFDQYLAASSPRRVKFSSQFYGAKSGEFRSPATACSAGIGSKVVVINDYIAFRRTSALEPVKSFLNSAIPEHLNPTK
jgi:hypothetical protein